MRDRGIWIMLAAAALGCVGAALYVLNPWRVPDDSVMGRLLGFKVFRQPSPGMEPTIHKGAFFIMRFFGTLHSDPAVGDVVVFKYAEDPSIYYAKRIVAKPGDTVALFQGHVVLNGQLIAEPYISPPGEEISEPFMSMKDVKIGANCYFVLSDNRAYSSDSRDYGCVPRDLIVGKVSKK